MSVDECPVKLGSNSQPYAGHDKKSEFYPDDHFRILIRKERKNECPYKTTGRGSRKKDGLEVQQTRGGILRRRILK